MAETSPDTRCKLVLDVLGFTGDPDYFETPEIDHIHTHGSAIRSAFRTMGVIGVFAPVSHLANGAQRRFPILYIIEAAGMDAADAAHRSIWSQSLVPMILVILPEGVQVRNSFRPKEGAGRTIGWDEMVSDAVHALLSGISATTLRSSLSWQNFATARMNRVDIRLYKLIRHVNGGIRETHAELADARAVANALIGRMLYLFVLIDRGIITQADINELKDHSGTPLCPDIKLELGPDAARHPWPAAQFWNLAKVIDETFNGAVFPLSEPERALLGDEAVNLCRDVLRKDDPNKDGSIQTAMFDVDYAALRTETISAIYEQFFALEDIDRKASEGAFYTPAYLVDYVLDEMDGIAPLSVNSIVCDPAAGSGAFLVSAFRRVVERKAQEGALPIRDLRTILQRTIHGFEKNAQAANVARFSLYLTMLDYLPGISFADMRASIRRGGVPLFPDLRENIRTLDFFSPLPPSLAGKVSHVVGNPPWTRFREDDSAAEYQANQSKSRTVAYRNLAELFVWRSMDDLLCEDGTLAMVISARSFIGSKVRDESFPTALVSQYRVHGITNLSHFRRKLFDKAGEPAAVVFASRKDAEPLDRTWRYSPLLTSQPLDRNGTPWSIVVDRGTVERTRQADLAGTARDWFHNLMLSPFDRIFAQRIESSQCTLGVFMDRASIEIARGGQPSETGIAEEFHLGTGTGHKNYLKRLGLDGLSTKSYALPSIELQKAREPFRTMFSGHALLMPRSGARIDYTTEPVAFNSSLSGMYFAGNDIQPAARETILSEIAAFLDCDAAIYLKALVGKAWILEQRRLEASDLRRMPFPFHDIGELLNNPPSLMTEYELTEMVAERCALGPRFANAVRDYVDMRVGFQNGKIPVLATKPVGKGALDAYRTMLEASLSAMLGEMIPVESSWDVASDGPPQLLVSIGKLDRVPSTNDWPSRRAGNFIEATTIQLTAQGDAALCRLNKPALAAAWTLDRAYQDAQLLMREAMRA